MATIVRFRRKKGTVYRAQIRLMREGKTYSEAKTFRHRAAAEAWAEARELELTDPHEWQRQKHRQMTVGDVLARYETEALEGFGRSKKAHIRQMQGMGIADAPVGSLTTGRIVDHLRSRREAGAGPATVNNDLVWLRVVCDYARHAWGIPIDMQALADAGKLARKHRVIGKSRERERRVSDAEIEQVVEQLGRMRTRYPMADIIWFAVYSARRQSEITGLRWADLDAATRTGTIRDVKHPTKKGNDRRCKFTVEAWAVIERQPRTGALVFPYQAKTISAYFTRAVAILELPDLRFHDLRHEATSRLFERGYSIQEVQQFTLHESWQMLSRYTHLRPEDVPDR